MTDELEEESEGEGLDEIRTRVDALETKVGHLNYATWVLLALWFYMFFFWKR